jgi:hypothetical protein
MAWEIDHDSKQIGYEEAFEDVRQQLTLHVKGPHAAMNAYTFEHLMHQVGEMRRQIAAAHEKLDMWGIPRSSDPQNPASSRFTVVGRLNHYVKCESCGSLHETDTSGGYWCPAKD